MRQPVHETGRDGKGRDGVSVRAAHLGLRMEKRAGGSYSEQAESNGTHTQQKITKQMNTGTAARLHASIAKGEPQKRSA